MVVAFDIDKNLRTPPNVLTFLWLEITGKCNLACEHCYADSSPLGQHGVMKTQDWERILFQAADMGCKNVQFIGGEPTVHPDLTYLIQVASQLHMSIEIYTNLVSIKAMHWDAFQANNVRIATSFYSANASVHDRITNGPHSFEKTVRNIEHVIQLGLPLRVGLIDMDDEQDLPRTKLFLQDLGVDRIRVDQTRSVGRGQSMVHVSKRDEALCGACTRGRAAVIPDGRVFPCVFSRHHIIGNVLHHSLRNILHSENMTKTREKLTLFFLQRQITSNDDPKTPCMPATEKYLQTQDISSLLSVCEPHECDPNCEPGECNPDLCQPSHTCIPDWKDPCAPATPCDPDAESCSPEWDKPEPEESLP